MASYAKDKSKVTGTTILGRYLSKMKLKQWRDYRWEHTEFLQELANNKIETSSDLESYYMKKNEELKLALGERGILWDRRASKKNEDIRQELCNQISEKTEIINRLRKEVLLCEDIKTRIPKMKENLNELKKEEKAREEELELKKNKRKEKRL